MIDFLAPVTALCFLLWLIESIDELLHRNERRARIARLRRRGA